ncbi:MAG: HAMP domain-containing histidine kinase, partial [Bacilli bacterium]|nr:HAMP domain-containing histidine kinase [Bacilli bacterium]
NSEIAYIYIDNSNSILVSDNLSEVINTKNIDSILNNINYKQGNFLSNKKLYYYVVTETKNMKKIAITGSSYINTMKAEILKTILIVVGITFIIISLLVIIWSNYLVNRIKKLKEKVDNINNNDYNHKMIYNCDDELYTLESAIEDMRNYLIEQEEYKNQMYQNISHDFKTPITVMKSYIEASEDGIQTKEKTLEVCKEQLNKLEMKVHSLLYLNKLNYFQKQKDKVKEKCDVSKIILSSVDKFSPSRTDVEFVLELDKKNNIFRGSEEMWEAIIDNVLNNFIRYAKTKIKITVKNNKIILYNDGPNIDKDILNSIFTPYEKGVNGVFGLGLSIVKKTLHFLNYDIDVINEKNGVKFIIS